LTPSAAILISVRGVAAEQIYCRREIVAEYDIRLEGIPILRLRRADASAPAVVKMWALDVVSRAAKTGATLGQ
jgi:hypothetical protein